MIRAAAPPTLAEFYRDSYRPLRLVGCSPRTLEAYGTALDRWEAFACATPLPAIDARLLAAWAEWLLPGRSAASVNCYLRHVLAILNHAAEEDAIYKRPKFKKLREPKRTPLALTEDEFRAVLGEAALRRGTIGGVPAPLWWRSLLCVGWETGLRFSALLAVRAVDVLLAAPGLFSQAEPQKDKEADWFVLSQPTAGLLEQFYDPGRALLWPRQYAECTISRHFRRILDASRIYAPTGACLAFHRIRRSTASYLRAAGGNATAKLGHSSPAVTERYYDPRIVVNLLRVDLVPAPSPRDCSCSQPKTNRPLPPA